MKSENPFPEPIWKARFPGRLDTIANRIAKYASDPTVTTKELMGNLVQRYNLKDNPHEWKELDEFNNWLGSFVSEVWKNWEYSLEEWEELRFKSWVNYNDVGSSIGEHTHTRDVMTIIFYINKPSDTGHLQLFNPLIFHWENTPRKDDGFWRDIPAKSGDVIIIPGWMMHRVSKNESTENRLSITINATITTKDNY
jgi:uncharacterized protein (TIGR02466 family)